MAKWRGWPAKHTQDRKDLDALYWGDAVRSVEKGWYLYPTIFSEAAIQPLALWRDAHVDDHDPDTRQVFRFAEAWAQWRARVGEGLSERRRRHTFTRKEHDTDFPPPCAVLLYGRLPR